MKKALLFVSILFVSVVTTACINNFAVQELNTKAKAYMEQGDYAAAIERLKSSIDLDDSNYETHYNLAVAYTKSEDYANAIEQYKQTLELNPDIPDVYYSLAVAEGNLTVDLKSGAVRIAEDGSLYTPEEDKNADAEVKEYKPDEKVLNMIDEFKADAVKNYQIYLEKAPQASDSAEVNAKIKELQQGEIPQE